MAHLAVRGRYIGPVAVARPCGIGFSGAIPSLKGDLGFGILGRYRMSTEEVVAGRGRPQDAPDPAAVPHIPAGPGASIQAQPITSSQIQADHSSACSVA